VGRCRLTPSNPRCNRLELSVVKLKYCTLLSSFGFNANLRRYSMDVSLSGILTFAQTEARERMKAGECTVRLCGLTLSNPR
jgi:hypothetical protein